MKNATPPAAVDLFSGIGGLSHGLVAAGFEVRAAVEIDPTSASSYRQNHPMTSLLVRDVRHVRRDELLQAAGVKPGRLALLTGCPPCQGYSTLRTRRRTSVVRDPRNELIFEMLRLIRSTRPRAVLLENVPGLASDRRFARFRRGLERAGYVSDFAIVDAQDFGVPQRRQRLVLVAFAGMTPPIEWYKPVNAPRRTVRDTIGGLPTPGASGDLLHDVGESRSTRVMARIKATPQDGGSRNMAGARHRLACHARSDGFSDVYGRMLWDAPAPTITSGCHNPSKGRFIHPVEDRAITLREAAMLQSFPRDYQIDLSRGKEHAAQQIGNAFPPLMILPIAQSLRTLLAQQS